MEILFWASAARRSPTSMSAIRCCSRRGRAWRRGRPRRRSSRPGPGPRSPSSSPRGTKRRGCPARIANLLDLPYDGPPRDHRRLRRLDRRHRARRSRRIRARRRPAHRGAGRRQAAGAERRRRGGDRRHPRLRRRAAAIRDRDADGAGRRTSPIPQVGGATGELVLDCESGDSDLDDRRRRRRLLEVREVAAPQRERDLRRRSARPARSTRCGGRSGSRCRPTRCSTTCSRRCARCWPAGASCSRKRRWPSDRTAPDAAAESRRKRRTLAGNYQILAQEPRLLLPVRQPGVAAVRLAQGRTSARAVGAARAVRLERGAGGQRLDLHRRVRRPGGFYGLAVVGAWLDARDRQPRGAVRARSCRSPLGKEAR